MEPDPSTAAVLTPPGASINDSTLETSSDNGIPGGHGGEQGSGDDGGFGEGTEEKVDYDAAVEDEHGQDGEDGAGGEQDGEDGGID